jgi:signal transduction histidine kinase
VNQVPGTGPAVEVELVLEALPDAYLVTDLTGAIRHANPAACQLLSRTRKRLEGSSLIDLLDDPEGATTALFARWAGSSAFRPGAVRLHDGRALRCDGARLAHHRLLWLRLRSREETLAPFRRVHDEVETTNLRELSRRLEASVAELGRANRQLLAANEEIQQYARAVAHDIRTPLFTIQGFARLLEQGDLVEGAGAEYVRLILESARRLANITDGVLAVARLEPAALPTTEIDTAAVARDALADLDADVRAVDAHVVIGDLHPVAVHEPSLRRVLQNLLGNSLRHGAVPGRPLRIEVSSRVVDTYIEISVRDDGSGIDDADRERIFTLFYSGQATPVPPGSGIGLASCRKLVNGWGGAIACEPVPGPGVRFFFTAPAANSIGAPRSPSPGRAVHAPSTSRVG